MREPLTRTVLVGLAALAGAWLSACGRGAAPATPLIPPTAAARAMVPPPVGRIVLVVMENHDYAQLIGSPDAPFLNGLAAQYALADNYGLRHPSLPNYLALLGGDTFGTTSDCTRCFVDALNLVDALEANNKTWKSYQEDVPGPCFLGTGSAGYVVRHNPFMYFRDVREDTARCQHVVPLSQFSADLQAGSLPDFAWVTPNVEHDMHDGSIAEGDQWLATFVPPILASDAWRQSGVLVITWDEGRSDDGCCGDAAGGHTPLLLLTPDGKPGYHSPHPVTPYGVLRTIEDLWGLPYLGKTGEVGVDSLLDVWP
jgi:phosphatidylinositol-3-phosphatase